MLKVNWNLKNPIKMPHVNDSFSNSLSSKHENFKATSIKYLNEKRFHDDSSFILRNFLNDESKNKSHRAVSLNPNKFSRNCESKDPVLDVKV